MSSQSPSIYAGKVNMEHQIMMDRVSKAFEVDVIEDRFDQEIEDSETSKGEIDMDDHTNSLTLG